MPYIRHQTSGSDDEFAAFIAEGTHRLATISTNDYGYLLSARMAQTYLERAVSVLESKQSFDRVILHKISGLKVTAQAIAREYAQLEKFCSDCDRFNRVETKDMLEWVSKWVVRAISRSYLGTASHHLAHKIRTFHSGVSSILIES
jgi:NifB/MoaA-like Fe-S oxidoreductase